MFRQTRKHIDTIYYFIRELVKNGEVNLKPCKSSDQLIDIFTKPFEKDVLDFHRGSLGVVSLVET